MNSLDMPLETESRNHIINENFVVKQSSLKKNSHQEGSSVKMLIDEMCNRANIKCGGPNVVAQLMGMDSLSLKTGPTIHVKECFDTKVDLSSLPSTLEKLPLNCKQQYSSSSTKNLSSAKPYDKEYPQEAQLQKFKKEFEAWQESKLWEFSSNLGHNGSDELKSEQILARENLNKEKMARYTEGAYLMQKTPVEIEDYISVNKLKITENQPHDSQHDGNFGKQLMPKAEDDMAIRREPEANSKPASRARFQEKRSTPGSPTRIVILKPSSDRNDKMEEPWGGSPEVVEKGSSMEDFLEKVKERLRLEMDGKGRNDSIRRLSVGHTSLHESSANPKQLALEVAKHGAILRRSQSMITYGNAFHFDGQKFSKSLKGATRKFISDRLKIILKNDTEMKKPMLDDGRDGKSLLVEEMARSKEITEGKDASFWEDKKAVNEAIPKHLGLEQLKTVPLGDEAMSLSNLVRSFSALASESAFGKALLDDRCVANEAYIFQKHETSNNDSAVVKKRKKDGFSIKSTVSNLRRNLGLRAKFFGKKVSSMEESTVDTVHYVKPNETMPSVFRTFGIVKDNSTEVPPSPASFPCSPINEYHSPVSPLEVPFVDDHPSTQVSGELSMILPELGSQTEHVEGEGCGMATQTQLYDSNETILIEDCGEAYVRNILVVSGLYSACWPLDQAISRLDGQIKPISSWVFDEVEERCRKLRNVDDDCSTVSLGDIGIDRKMLFDLVNEALPRLLDAPMTQLMSKRLTHSLTQLPHGRELLDYLLNQIQIYENPKFDQPQYIDKMVAWDLKWMPWSTVSHEDTSSLGREVEWVIMRELIDDLLADLLV